MRSNDSDDGRAHARTVEEIESESGELDPEPKHAQAARLGRTVRHRL